jgi:hypothetical protein
MDVTPCTTTRSAPIKAKTESLWQRIVRGLDRFAAQRRPHLAPAVVLSRSKYDIDRRRRLIHRAHQ